MLFTFNSFSDIVSAVHYLHELDIAHRDLKCENIFLTSNENVMIGDFGFARTCRDLKTQKPIVSKTFCGSAAYAAPEILQVKVNFVIIIRFFYELESLFLVPEMHLIM